MKKIDWKNIFLLSWKKTAIALILFIVFVFMHNLVYGLFIYLFGENFWGNGDEPVFFILAVIVIPLYFIISIIYTIYLKMSGGKK